MPELKRCLEEAGYANVRTVLASGNAVFTGPERPEHELESRLQQLLATRLTRSFPVIVRPLASIQQLLTTDPFRDFQLAPTAKRVVTFLRELPGPGLSLPIEFEGARILRVREREVFTAYVPHPSGPVFMTLIEKTFGKDVTTRTWDTVQKLTRGEPAR
jgi:uncharacterized protein (DUF1697 family)